jgi:hypothetical protein
MFNTLVSKKKKENAESKNKKMISRKKELPGEKVTK